MEAAGAAVVVADDRARRRPAARPGGRADRRSGAPRGDGRPRRPPLARPEAAGAGRGRGPGGDPRSWTGMSEPDWNGRELHFIAIGGAGMSGLALICHAPRRPGDRQRPAPKARTSSASARRASTPVSATMPRRSPSGPRSWSRPRSRESNPELVRARERGQRVIHRGELLAEIAAATAADRRRRRPRQDDHRRHARLGARRGRATPSTSAASFPGSPALAARRRTRAGARGSGWSPRPTSRTPASSPSNPRSR